MSARPDCDVWVVGSGFGGLGAALESARRGLSVKLSERLTYPGGCASTFRREGCLFESGATLGSGFGPGQLFERWNREHDLGLAWDVLDPVVELRAPGLELAVPPAREPFLERLAEATGAPRERLAAFLRTQSAAADVLWEILEEPRLWLPFGPRGLLAHLVRAPRTLPLARFVGRSLEGVLRAHGLGDCEPLRLFADAVAQITVQCSAGEVEALFGLGTFDYFQRGTAHVHGGLGALAHGLARAIEGAGGEVHYADEVRGLERDGDLWRVRTRRGEGTARHVVLDVLPQAARNLLGLAEGEHRGLDRRARAVERGWGACMLYLVLDAPPGTPTAARHVELVADPDRPLVEGNHVFCSISSAAETDRAPDGRRTATVSTHVPMAKLRALTEDERAAYVNDVQARMRRTIAERAPELDATIHRALPASPRTFQRFTARPFGYVGGVPRRRGREAWSGLIELPPLPGLHLVGDSVFPGQSILATALGGTRAASRIARKVPTSRAG